MSQTRTPNILQVIRKGHPTLSSRAKEIEDPTDPEIREIVEDILATIEVIGPIAGLAAPQLNIPLRLFFFQVAPHRTDDGTVIPLTLAINPSYEVLSEEKTLAWEGCFSLPHVMGEVPRYKHIRYSYQTLEGETVTREAHGFHARVFQHELDHLDGITYVERMTDMSRFGYIEEVKEYMIRL